MSTLELRFCLRPPRELWRKPERPATAEGAMVGWVRDVSPIDSSVPPDAAAILAAALTDGHRLTFIDPGAVRSPEWQDLGGRWVRFLRPGGLARLLPSAGYALTSTLSPAIAMRLFDTEESLWGLESQIVLLTRRDAPPPEVSFGTLDDLIRSQELDLARVQSEFDGLGLLTPGPDGDFAQIALWQPGAMGAFARTLRLKTEKVGVPFAEVSESEFRQTKWFAEEIKR